MGCTSIDVLIEKMILTTNKVFCANNPIEIDVTISNTNLADFRNHFKGIVTEMQDLWYTRPSI